MRLLILTGADVRRLMSMRACMDVVADALAALARGEAANPLRTILWLPDGSGAFGTMPAYVGGSGALGLKAISVFPGNHGSELDSHQGLVLLFESGRGRPLAVVDASAITAVRTAAASGVATRALARAEARELAILGTGVQAGTHLEAMLVARQISRVRVWSPTASNACAFADGAAARHGIPVEATASAREAIAGADVVCTVTASREPVLEGAWLEPGMHVNAVGSSSPAARELDAAAVARSRLFVDRRESTLAEAGDFLMARAEGAVTDDHILGELGDVLVGRVAGRATPEEITLFKSLGLGVEDVAAAHFVYAEAERAGAGTWVEI